METEIRWKQRFENYARALGLLREALDQMDQLSALEKEGTVQRFEFTLELAWKTLKDYLEFNGVLLTQMTPRNVIREAFSAKIIEDGQLWIDMLDCRNRMSHTYDESAFGEAVQEIATRYLDGFEQLHHYLISHS